MMECIVLKTVGYRVRNGEGIVYVYYLECVRFTLVVTTYFDGRNEYAWGMGLNENEALADAEAKWKRRMMESPPFKNYNPFTEVIQIVEKQVSEE